MHRHDLKTRKSDVAAAGVQFFEVALSGEKMLTRQGGELAIRNVPPAPPAGGGDNTASPCGGCGGTVERSNVQVRVSPREDGSRCTARPGGWSAAPYLRLSRT